MREITIGWLLPALMSTYGDRGNLFCLKKRAECRGIKAAISPITENCTKAHFAKFDIVVGGGGQNQQQEIAWKILQGKVGKWLVEKLEEGSPALFICGAMQLLGRKFQLSADGLQEGLGFFDCETFFSPHHPRITGDLIFEVVPRELESPLVVGFENHGGQTFLRDARPLGKVLVGKGNNGRDGTEGVFHKHSIGSYAHGPLLPKNPALADWLIKQALMRRYGSIEPWDPIEFPYITPARDVLLNRYGLVSLAKKTCPKST